MLQLLFPATALAYAATLTSGSAAHLNVHLIRGFTTKSSADLRGQAETSRPN
jgi:hypothetical protein